MNTIVGLCITSSFHIVAARIKDNQQLYQRRQCLPISPQI
jgi:hypothetical protein